MIPATVVIPDSAAKAIKKYSNKFDILTQQCAFLWNDVN